MDSGPELAGWVQSQLRAYEDLLIGANVAVIATVDGNGVPEVTPVWIDYESGEVRFSTAVTTEKAGNLRNNPSVSICIVDPNNPYRYVQLSGRASLATEGAREHLDAMARRYWGLPEYPSHDPHTARLLVRVTPTRVRGIDGSASRFATKERG